MINLKIIPLTQQFLELPRNIKRLIILSVDLLLLPFSLWASFSLRLGEFFVPIGYREETLYLFLAAPVIAIPIFAGFGLYRAIIRFIGFVAMWAIIKAVSLFTLVFGLIIFLSGISGVPRSVILINWLVLVLMVGSTRAIGRWWLAGSFKLAPYGISKSRVVIYGAGAAGVQIATMLASSTAYKPVAYIDDSKSLVGSYIEGLRVYSFEDLDYAIKDLLVSDVLLAMPSISRSRRSEIISRLEPYSLHVTILPALDDLASGRVKVDDIREVGIGDLLGRDPVDPNLDLLHANIKDKVVLVTGAGGSIGAELCRQIIKIKPDKLILYERGEHELYSIENELIDLAQRQDPEQDLPQEFIIPILASILDQGRVESVCKAFGVQTIYHAAAYKHVPMVERNPLEAVRNNVLGTHKVALAAIDAGVETFVLVSTDKAVRPTSTMGATKRFAEMILQGLAKKGCKTRFTMVRFGNVLGSSGSVVLLFREQIKNGGPVTVTDPKIIRYFMTIPEAAQLVIQAGAMGHGGDVFVLDMGDPVKILDMARRMIHLSGFEVRDEDNPNGDIEITFTGLRPGEKLYEELLIGENVQPTRHKLIMSADEEGLSWKQVEILVEQFIQVVDNYDVEKSRILLIEAVSEFQPQCEVADLVFGQSGEIKTDKVSKKIVKIR